MYIRPERKYQIDVKLEKMQIKFIAARCKRTRFIHSFIIMYIYHQSHGAIYVRESPKKNQLRNKKKGYFCLFTIMHIMFQARMP